jgi:hypothetical protein
VQHLVGIGALLVWGNYRAMQRVLKYVLLVFVAYVVAAFLAHPNGGDVLYHTPSRHTVGVWALAKRAHFGPRSPALYTGTSRPGISYCTMSVAVGSLVGDVMLTVDSATPNFTSVSPVLAATCWKHVRARVVG